MSFRKDPKVLLVLATVPAYGCGQEIFCSQGEEAQIVFDQQELGERREWDGDSYWTKDLTGELNDGKIRLCGVDFPEIKGSNDIANCNDRNPEYCQPWEEYFGSPLNLESIDLCHRRALGDIEREMEGHPVCLVEDEKSPSESYGRAVRYIDVLIGDNIVDLSEWLLERGYVIPFPTDHPYGDCERCDTYRDSIGTGCLWEERIER